jgi:hypothetical protein
LERVEELKKPAEDDTITVRHARVKALPGDYVVEKHEVLVKGWPSETPIIDCELEERPGPGPELDFGFKDRTILFRYVSTPPFEDSRLTLEISAVQ